MKKNLFIGIAIILMVAAIAYAQTVNRQIYGVATPGLYKYDLATNTQDAYLLAVPTLTGNDTFVGLTSTQTLTNKGLSSPLITSPTITFPTITGTTSIGAGATITSPVITNPDVSFALSSKVFTLGEDWTLSATEGKSLLLSVFSGSGTPSIIAPTTSGKIYILRNSGNIAVTLKQSGGTGISVASSKTAVLINNGSDYIRVTADASQ